MEIIGWILGSQLREKNGLGVKRGDKTKRIWSMLEIIMLFVYCFGVLYIFVKEQITVESSRVHLFRVNIHFSPRLAQSLK